MRVLIANKFYYRRGGDCVCTIGLEQLLRANGHQTAVFAMQHPDNLPSEWSRYFPTEVSFNSGMKGAIEAARRPLGTRQVSRLFRSLVRDFRPDVVHMNNIHSQLSPVISEVAKQEGVPVVWTLHDYKLICPRYDCLRAGTGGMCTDCIVRPISVVKNRCIKGSLPASVIGYMEARRWNRRRLSRITDLFIGPSRFMQQQMIAAGYPREKVVHLYNFIDTEQFRSDSYDLREDYLCYIGRLSGEKGVGTLVRAVAGTDVRLRIAGSGPEMERLQKEAGRNVKFLGHLSAAGVRQLVGKARALVIPSEWCENNPMSVLEALCMGTPVLGAEIGGIPELITPGVTGLTFESGNVESLRQRLGEIMAMRFDHRAIAERAQQEFSHTAHYARLMELYKSVLR